MILLFLSLLVRIVETYTLSGAIPTRIHLCIYRTAILEYLPVSSSSSSQQSVMAMLKLAFSSPAHLKDSAVTVEEFL